MPRRLVPILLITLLGFVHSQAYAQRLEVSPRILAFPCTIDREISALPITISNNGPVTLYIDGFRLSPGSAFIPPRGNFKIAPGQTHVDTVWFAPKGGPGTWQDRLTIVAASDVDVIALVGSSSPPPELVPRPALLNFQEVSGLDTAEQCVHLENPSCKPIVITHLDLDNANFRLLAPPALPYTIPGNQRLELCIELLPGLPGGVTGRLTIETDLSRNRTLILPLQGRRGGPGLVIVPPRGLEFGLVPIGIISREMKIGVVNQGPTPAMVENVWELAGPDSEDFIVYPPTLPAQLAPGRNDTLWFAVRFAPSAEGQKLATLRLQTRPPTEPAVLLRGTGTRTGLMGSPLNIDLGEVLAGSSRTFRDTVLLHNIGREPVSIVAVEMIGQPPDAFDADGPASKQLAPGESIRYSLTFAPATVGPYRATLLFHLGDGSLLPVRLQGAGVARERYRVWIDSATAEVNQPCELNVRITPDLTPAAGITEYTLRLRFSATALYLHRATAADGTENPVSYSGADTITIVHKGSMPISGPILATLSLEGLVTGHWMNPVELVEVTIGGDTSTSSIWGNGLVELRGCDIGFGVGFGRPVTARSIWPAPAGDRIMIRYIAPADAIPGVAIIDLNGRTYERPALPPGTGAEQETMIDLRDLDPGFYILELRSGSGRSSLPVVIAR